MEGEPCRQSARFPARAWRCPKPDQEEGPRRPGSARGGVHSADADRACLPRAGTSDLAPAGGGADLESPAVPSETRMKLTSPNFCSSSVSGTGMKSRWENHAAHSVRSVLERGSYS